MPISSSYLWKLHLFRLKNPIENNPLNKDIIEQALKTIRYPGFTRDIVSFGLVREVRFAAGKALIKLELSTSDPTIPVQLQGAIKSTLHALNGIQEVDVDCEVSTPRTSPFGKASPFGNPQRLPNVRHTLAVASGKGGVGKSTFAVNLACALDSLFSAAGKPRSIGLLDCDIYGPSVPLMLGVNAQPEIADNKLVPPENFDIRVMSMGLLIDADTPVVWRGPMITKAIRQFLENVAWGTLEILVVDLPPGTGDAHLTLAQNLALDGALVLTTPQKAAAHVACRGASMFPKVAVPILGVVENMSYIELPETQERRTLFGTGGGARTAAALDVELLGQIPLDECIRIGADNGIPLVISHPDSPAAAAFLSIAQRTLEKMAVALPNSKIVNS